MKTFLRKGAFAAGSIGIAVLLKRNFDETLKEKEIALEESQCKLFFAKLFPSRMLSRLWGSVCELELPVKFREPIYGAWINAFKCDMTDVLEKDLTKYQNMQEFFIRKLHGAARPIDPDHDLISPVDGTVLAFGKIDKSTGLSISKVKGVKFSLKSLIGEPSSSDSVKDHSSDDDEDLGSSSYFCTIYLSPADYHRFHSPANWVVDKARHFTGELFSVNPRMLKLLDGIFVLNERICLMGAWKHGFLSMSFVGATNVGSIHVPDFPFQTNNSLFKDDDPSKFREVDGGAKDYEKGQELGFFRLGSSVVLVFDAPAGFEFCIKENEKVKLGIPLGRTIS